MTRLLIILAFILCISPTFLLSQDLEDLWESAGDDPTLRWHFESLEDNPIDLNTTTAASLEEMLFLDPMLSNAIIAYRDQHYPLNDIDELLQIPGISSETFRAISPYITVRPVRESVQIHYKLQTRFYRRYPHSRGYSEDIYRGDPMGSYSAISGSRGNIFLGGLVQKDPGESRWNDHQALFLRVDNLLGYDNRFVIGTYRLGFGEGLILSNGYRLSSSTADPMAILPRQPLGVREFQSTSETQYFQGAAVQNRFHRFSSAFFISRLFQDASLDEGGDVKTIQTSGLHRTASEEANREQLREDLWGGHLDYTIWNSTIGVTGFHSEYEPRLGVRDLENQHFDLEGGTNSVIGANGKFQLGAVHLGGEIAWSESGGQAFLLEGRYTLSDFQTSCIYRRYDPDFQNPHAVTLTEWGEEAQNEEGWLLAAKIPLWHGAMLTTRTDIVQTLWRTYLFPMTRHSTGIVASLDQSLGHGHQLTLRYRGSQTENLENEIIIDEIRSGARVQWDWRENKSRSYRLRWEQIEFETPASLESGTGWLLYGQVTVSDNRKLSSKFRLATFDVPVYGARIYAYEDDLPGRLVNLLFYGRGRRLSSRIKWSVTSGWNLWLKAAATFYDGVESVGSGYDEIPSRHTYDIGVALEWKR